tara:strand:- start:116 stop:529 length:414 start_codon:yes stop_codon:yes gene_type:complete
MEYMYHDEINKCQRILCEKGRRDLSSKVKKEFREFWFPKLEYINDNTWETIADSMIEKYPHYKPRNGHVSVWNWVGAEIDYDPNWSDSLVSQGHPPYERKYDKYKFFKRNSFTKERVYFMTKEEGKKHCFDYETKFY